MKASSFQHEWEYAVFCNIESSQKNKKIIKNLRYISWWQKFHNANIHLFFFLLIIIIIWMEKFHYRNDRTLYCIASGLLLIWIGMRDRHELKMFVYQTKAGIDHVVLMLLLICCCETIIVAAQQNDGRITLNQGTIIGVIWIERIVCIECVHAKCAYF